jgi:two-component system response regulator MprA
MNRKRVLIIEDDPDLIEDLPRAFQAYELDAVGESDLGKAVAQAGSGDFDCVILDLRMPPAFDMTDEETKGGRLTGVVVCRRLRAVNPTIPVLVYTIASDPEDHKLAMQAGANSIMIKPCFTDQLVQAIRLLLPKTA